MIRGFTRQLNCCSYSWHVKFTFFFNCRTERWRTLSQNYFFRAQPCLIRTWGSFRLAMGPVQWKPYDHSTPYCMGSSRRFKYAKFIAWGKMLSQILNLYYSDNWGDKARNSFSLWELEQITINCIRHTCYLWYKLLQILRNCLPAVPGVPFGWDNPPSLQPHATLKSYPYDGQRYEILAGHRHNPTDEVYRQFPACFPPGQMISGSKRAEDWMQKVRQIRWIDWKQPGCESEANLVEKWTEPGSTWRPSELGP